MLRTAILFLSCLSCASGQIVIQPNYCFGMLMAAPNRPSIPNEEAQKIQAGHMAHLNALAEKRWLVAAGPMVTPGNVRGLVISKCKSLDEAKQLAAQDPAVRNGRLYLEAYPWQAPEGLGDRYWAQHDKDPQAKVAMLKYPVAFMVKSVHWNGMPAVDRLKEHGAYVSTQLASGKMKSAGPFLEGGAKVCVFLFRSREDCNSVND